MIDRVERKHLYSMNRAVLPAVTGPEPDEVLEYKWIRFLMPPRRVPGEALVKFGRQGRCQQKSVPQSSAPFDVLPRAPKMRQLLSASVAAPSTKKRPHIGQEIQLEGRPAVLTWLGETKFEVAIAGQKTKLRLKHSDYPELKRGKFELRRHLREQNDVAS